MTSSATGSERVVALGGDRDDVRAARADLLDVGDHLVEDRHVGRDADDRRGLVEQRDRAVLHLPAGVRVGRDVGDLLELQRALERDRAPHVAAEVEVELRVGVALGGGLDRRVEGSMSSVMRVGQVLDLPDELGDPLGRHRAAQLGEAQREQVHRRDLADERLRRGDRDLEAGARVEHAVGVARGLRADDVRARRAPSRRAPARGASRRACRRSRRTA